jgi:2-phosphosulfolactate phosphatase
VTAKARPITVGSFSEGAAVSRGSVVVIDVIRAFTTAAVALSRGAEAIVMVEDVDHAVRLRAQGVGRYCMGERGGVKPDGFDFGNSPGELAAADLAADLVGAVLIQTTTNGTRGIAAAAAAGAERIYAGAFVTAEATVRALLTGPSEAPVALVAIGYHDRIRSDEDELCALYLRGRLEGREPDKGALVAALRSLLGEPGETERLFADLTAADLETCLTLDRYPFAVRVMEQDGLLVARAEAVE